MLPLAVGGVSTGALGFSGVLQVIVELMDASSSIQTPPVTGCSMPAVLQRWLHQDCMTVRNHAVCFPITPAVRAQSKAPQHTYYIEMCCSQCLYVKTTATVPDIFSNIHHSIKNPQKNRKLKPALWCLKIKKITKVDFVLVREWSYYSFLCTVKIAIQINMT